MNEALLAAYLPEEALLLACARLHMDEAAVERARAQVARGPDWTRFWDLACRHSVAPLLHRSLPAVTAVASVPAGVLAQAEHAYSLNALRNALRYDTLGALLQALRAAAVPVIVLKGAALAERIYGDPALRVFGDVDLLVRSDEDKRRAGAAIRDIERPFMLELAADHYDLWIDLPGPWATEHLPWAEMWAAAEPARIAGVETLVLNPAHEMVMLVTNFVRRGFAPLKLLVDIAEMARYYHDAMPWEQMATISARCGLDRFNWYVLGLARDLLDAPVPDSLLARPPDLQLSRSARQTLGYKRAHFLNDVPVRSLLTLGVGGPRERLRALRLRLLPERRWLARVYGLPRDARRVYLYYPRWMIEVAARYGRTILSVVRHRLL